jgi:hypothetical protein
MAFSNSLIYLYYGGTLPLLQSLTVEMAGLPEPFIGFIWCFGDYTDFAICMLDLSLLNNNF